MTTKTMTPVEKTETTASIFLSVKLENPSIADIQQAVEQLEKHPKFKRGSKFYVTFSEELEIRRDYRKVVKTAAAELKFFTSREGTYAYTFHKSSGYPLYNIDYEKMAKISYRMAKDPESERKEQAEKILNRRYDEQTWNGLTADDVEHHGHSIVNMKRKFDSYVIEELQKAFENKTDYRHTKYGKKRKLTVSTKMGTDGVFRAWFASEYTDQGHGQYYILLNPTTASFCEWD